MIRPKMAGADTSAEWFDVCVLDGSKRHAFHFARTQEGLDSFGFWLADLGIQKVWMAIEHTGGYERLLALWLLEHGHQVSLADPQQVRTFRSSLGVKAKTDSIDAYVLARFTKHRRPALWTPRPDPYLNLLSLVRHRESLLECLIMWKNRLNAPTTDAYVRSSQQTLAQVLELQIADTEKRLRECIDSDPELKKSVELLETVKGLKFLSATKFLAEAGPISGYPTPESLAMAAGLTPLPCCSGKSKGHRGTPYGNQRLRQSIAMAATVARRYNPALAYFAQRIASKGGKTKALLNKAVKRKLCHVIWGMLTKQEKFDPEKAVRGFTMNT